MQQIPMHPARGKTRCSEHESRALDGYAPASRLFAVHSMLASPGGITIGDVMKQLGVSRMTVGRYLRALENAGTMIDEEKIGSQKRFRLHASSRQETVRLTTAQIVSLVFTRHAVDFLRGTGLAEDLDDVFEKLEATLRRKDRIEARNLDRKLFDVNEEPYLYRGKVAHVDQLVTGLLREERLEVRHASVGEGRRRFLVDPYTLLLYRKGLYLAGFSHHHGAVRKFGLDAFRSIQWKRGDRFEYPAKYKPASLLKGAFGFVAGDAETVRVRFDADVARYVRRRKWHASQRCRTLADGSVEMRLLVAPNFEVKNWLLRFGSKAEILEPAKLRAELAKEIATMAARYSSSGTGGGRSVPPA